MFLYESIDYDKTIKSNSTKTSLNLDKGKADENQRRKARGANVFLRLHET
jgi:hypothetical protein